MDKKIEVAISNSQKLADPVRNNNFYTKQTERYMTCSLAGPVRNNNFYTTKIQQFFKI